VHAELGKNEFSCTQDNEGLLDEFHNLWSISRRIAWQSHDSFERKAFVKRYRCLSSGIHDEERKRGSNYELVVEKKEEEEEQK
jgi:hypothetical protein